MKRDIHFFILLALIFAIPVFSAIDTHAQRRYYDAAAYDLRGHVREAKIGENIVRFNQEGMLVYDDSIIAPSSLIHDDNGYLVGTASHYYEYDRQYRVRSDANNPLGIDWNDPTFINDITFTYNDKGYISSSKEDLYIASLTYSTEYEYTDFDEHGNWTKRTSYTSFRAMDTDGEETIVSNVYKEETERHITYWENTTQSGTAGANQDIATIHRLASKLFGCINDPAPSMGFDDIRQRLEQNTNWELNLHDRQLISVHDLQGFTASYRGIKCTFASCFFYKGALSSFDYQFTLLKADYSQEQATAYAGRMAQDLGLFQQTPPYKEICYYEGTVDGHKITISVDIRSYKNPLDCYCVALSVSL